MRATMLIFYRRRCSSRNLCSESAACVYVGGDGFDYRDRGRPSSWSAAVDGLAADTDGAGENPRLFVLSAGNTRDPNAWAGYPDSLSTNLVHDPGQAWNAITVGACTEKIDTKDIRPLNPVAEAGGLSPFTTTTQTWDRAWPLKPEVVLEGGNAAKG